jgi:hypothetical protein
LTGRDAGLSRAIHCGTAFMINSSGIAFYLFFHRHLIVIFIHCEIELILSIDYDFEQ